MKDSLLTTRFVKFLFLGLILFLVFFILFGIKELIFPIMIAYLIALFLNPIVYFFESSGIPRFFSVILTFLVLILFIYISIYLILPFFIAEINKTIDLIKYIIEKLPETVEKLKNQYSFLFPENEFPQLELKWIIDFIYNPIKKIPIFDLIPNIFTFIIITPILIFIFLLEGDEIYQYLISFVPNRFFEMTIMITYNIRNSIVSYLKGLSIQILIVGVICISGLWIIDVPYAIVLGSFAALTNTIPYIGPVIGFIPILTVTAIANISLVPFSILVFGIAQIVDNVFTQPVILARSVNVHPIIGILALITFQKWLGWIGMLIAIPLAGIIVMTIQIMYKSLKAFDII